MDLTEKTLSSEKIFDGKILHIRRDTALLPNGQEAVREVVDHPGGVCVVALDDENRVLLVRQFRYPYMQLLREIPAGKLEYGEDPREAALRELREGNSSPWASCTRRRDTAGRSSACIWPVSCISARRIWTRTSF